MSAVHKSCSSTVVRRSAGENSCANESHAAATSAPMRPHSAAAEAPLQSHGSSLPAASPHTTHSELPGWLHDRMTFTISMMGIMIG